MTDRIWILVMTALFSGFAFGCASAPQPERNPRNGLLDQLASLTPANSAHGRNSPPAQSVSTREMKAVEVSQYKNVSMHWPLSRVQVTSRFGQRDRDFHEGVDLRARLGTPVLSAHSGKILYAGNSIRGYGNMIVVGDSRGLATVYAHNSRLFVRRGQRVIQGQRIALTGKSGHVRGPHLHFEVRVGTQAVDPISFMQGARKVSSVERVPSRRAHHRAVASN